MQELTHQLGTEAQSVRVLELESERKLAEERIAELESQLAVAPMLDAQGMRCQFIHAHVTTSFPNNTGMRLPCCMVV